MVTETITIKAPIQVVYDCIIDFEAYPKFLSEMQKVKIDMMEDKQMEVSFKINLVKEIAYTLRFELDPPVGIYWKLKRGDMMKTNTGSWELEMLDDPLTRAKYSIDMDFSLWVPKSITNVLVEKNLPKTLKAFKKRAERKFKEKSK